jgi:hypothetical protein
MGPVLPAAAAAWYWFTSGDLLPLDWLVLGELALVATGAWLSAVAAAAEDGRALSANPLRAALLFHRVGLPASAVTAAATALGFWHGRRSAAALEALHGTPFVGFVELAFECVVATYLATFLWRYLGVACYHSRPRAPAPVAAPISDSERGCQLPDRSL